MHEFFVIFQLCKNFVENNIRKFTIRKLKISKPLMRPSKLLFDEIVAKISPIYGINEAKSITFLLFEQFTGFTKMDILTNKTLTQNYDFEPLIERLLNHEPIQYITGNGYFLGLKFLVEKGTTLIPRPETEELTLLAIEKLKEMKKSEYLKVLDIGTGTGCIPISIAKALDFVNVNAWDISEKALKIAKMNADLNSVKVNFQLNDILNWKAINCDKFDLIISNPPYVTNAEKAEMNKNVLDFEPHLALFVGDDEPLIFYKNIVEFANFNLKNGGHLSVEINENFCQETVKLFENSGFKSIELLKDIHGKDRMISAKKPLT
jgi:release factor glutamine methyltransferase